MHRETHPSWLVLAVRDVERLRWPDRRASASVRRTRAVRPLPLRESELIAQGRALPDYDVRGTSGGGVDAQLRSTADLRHQVGPDTLVQFDARSGGVSQIFQPAGYLTDPQAGAPSVILNSFLVEHADVFGLSSAGISDFITIAEDRDGRPASPTCTSSSE